MSFKYTLLLKKTKFGKIFAREMEKDEQREQRWATEVGGADRYTEKQNNEEHKRERKLNK